MTLLKNPAFLRDGSETYYPGCGRIVKFDVRSKNYGILEASPPDGGIDLRKRELISKVRVKKFGDPLLNQGELGACGGMGYTAAEEYEAIIKSLGSEWAINLYFEVQKRDRFPGGEYPGADPVAGGTSILDILNYALNMGYITSFRHAFTLEQCIIGIGYFGTAIVGLMWKEGMIFPDRDGICRPVGNNVGGHCTAATFVDMRRKLIGGPNSWADWNPRRNGYWVMTFRDFEMCFHRKGECAFIEKKEW